MWNGAVFHMYISPAVMYFAEWYCSFSVDMLTFLIFLFLITVSPSTGQRLKQRFKLYLSNAVNKIHDYNKHTYISFFFHLAFWFIVDSRLPDINCLKSVLHNRPPIWSLRKSCSQWTLTQRTNSWFMRSLPHQSMGTWRPNSNLELPLQHSHKVQLGLLIISGGPFPCNVRPLWMNSIKKKMLFTLLLLKAWFQNE